MTSSENRNRILRRITAIVLVIFAAGTLFYFQDNFLMHSLALFVLMVAVLVVNPRQKPIFPSQRTRERQQALAIRPWHWLVGFALTGAAIAAFVWLYYDAVTGYKKVAPVYAFAASGFLCGIWWAGLCARWVECRS